MRTLPREPWRGGQICGYQTNVGGWSEGEAEYCGEFKKPGSPVCEQHDKELREDNYGVLPKFAPGNALGLELTFCSASWLLRDADGELVAGSARRETLESMYGFDLQWEAYEVDTPIDATPAETAAWEAS